MTPAYVVLLFIIYSFIGWILEVLCSLHLKHRFINRGFLYAPLCPIYGAGGILAVTLLEPFSGNLLQLAVFGMIYSNALEYATSWGMEKLFHKRWWDYSKSKFNVNGRVCLLNTIVFGLFAVFIVRVFQPLVVSFLSHVPVKFHDVLALSLLGFVIIDAGLTITRLLTAEKKSIPSAQRDVR